MKKILLTATMILFAFIMNVNAQDVKQEQTKMEAFASKTGAITKFTDSNLPNIPLSYGAATARIRTIKRGTEALFFCQIEKKGEYGSKVASIEYSDLLEIIKAFNSLKKSVDGDVALNPDYMENKFVTSDGFQLGYYVSKGKANWYMTLEKYGKDNTIFLSDAAILYALENAKNKIEELKLK